MAPSSAAFGVGATGAGVEASAGGWVVSRGGGEAGSGGAGWVGIGNSSMDVSEDTASSSTPIDEIPARFFSPARVMGKTRPQKGALRLA